MPRVFISYRRADSADVTGRLADQLADRFGPDNVFFDRERLEPGTDFPAEIVHQLRRSTDCLVVIGENWLTDRIRNPDDWVRQEVDLALKNGLRVVPVLVDSAAMPRADQLPATLRELADKQAFRIGENFSSDVDLLCSRLGGRRRRLLAVVLAVVLLLGALAVHHWWPRPVPLPASTAAQQTKGDQSPNINQSGSGSVTVTYGGSQEKKK